MITDMEIYKNLKESGIEKCNGVAIPNLVSAEDIKIYKNIIIIASSDKLKLWA